MSNPAISLSGTGSQPAWQRPQSADTTANQEQAAHRAALHTAADTYNSSASNPYDVANEERRKAAEAAKKRTDEKADPGTFRKILEVLEVVARGFLPGVSNLVNMLSAVVRLTRLLIHPPAEGEFEKEMARLGLDIIGTVLPAVSALGHLAFNALDPSDTELLAGWDEYLHKTPLIGGFFPDQTLQGAWLASGVRSIFEWTYNALDGVDSKEQARLAEQSVTTRAETTEQSDSNSKSGKLTLLMM